MGPATGRPHHPDRSISGGMVAVTVAPTSASATPRTTGWRRARRRLGVLYALPTAVYVVVFFAIVAVIQDQALF